MRGENGGDEARRGDALARHRGQQARCDGVAGPHQRASEGERETQRERCRAGACAELVPHQDRGRRQTRAGRRRRVPARNRWPGSSPENSTVRSAHSEVMRLRFGGRRQRQGGKIERVIAEQAVDPERQGGWCRPQQGGAAAQRGDEHDDRAADGEDDGRGLERGNGAPQRGETGQRGPQQDGAHPKRGCGSGDDIGLPLPNAICRVARCAAQALMSAHAARNHQFAQYRPGSAQSPCRRSRRQCDEAPQGAGGGRRQGRRSRCLPRAVHHRLSARGPGAQAGLRRLGASRGRSARR